MVKTRQQASHDERVPSEPNLREATSEMQGARRRLSDAGEPRLAAPEQPTSPESPPMETTQWRRKLDEHLRRASQREDRAAAADDFTTPATSRAPALRIHGVDPEPGSLMQSRDFDPANRAPASATASATATATAATNPERFASRDTAAIRVPPALRAFAATNPAARALDRSRERAERERAVDQVRFNIAPSVTSTTSCTTEARKKQAELIAAERIAELRRERLRIEEEVINKQLEAELQQIEAEGSRIGGSQNHMDQDAAQRMDAWFDRAEVSNSANINRERPTLRRQRTITPHRAEHSRPSRTASRHEDIDRLADRIENMSRPPPKQVYELPMYTGQPNEWLTFYHSYTESTQRYKFSNFENMARLRAALKGEARECVQHMLASCSSPDLLVRILRKNFGRTDVLVDRALEDLKRLPALGPSASDLNTFSIKVMNIVATLMDLDKSNYAGNPFLIREITDRLSPHLRSRWCTHAREHMRGGECEIVLLAEFLLDESDAELQFSHSRTPTSRRPAATNLQPPQPSRYPNRVSTGAAPRRPVPVRAQTYATERVDACLCCGNAHRTTDCRKLLGMRTRARWNWAREGYVCFKCLDKRHRRESCTARGCGVPNCPHSHHKLLHESTPPANRAPPNVAQNRPVRSTRSAPRISPAPVEEDAQNERAHTTTELAANTAVAADSQVLLKIIPIIVSGPNGEFSTYCMLDEGSTVSLIDQELADQLGVSGPEKPLVIQGVGSICLTQPSQRVEVSARAMNGGPPHTLALRTVARLGLRQQYMSRSAILRYEHLADLNEACYDHAAPKILLGADHWHLTLPVEIRTGRQCDPVGVRCKIGWTIYGVAPRYLRNTGTRENVQHVISHEDSEIDTVLRRYFDIDSLDVELIDKRSPREIAELTEPEQWRWVPTRQNPADDGTRSDPHRIVRSTDRWYVGPEFLRKDEDEWPREPAAPPTEPPVEITEQVPVERCYAGSRVDPPLPKIERFSNYDRLIGATARALLFIERLKKKSKVPLETRHMLAAENLWMQWAQRQDFPEELRALSRGESISRTSKLYKLDPELQEDGLIHMRGRIDAAPTTANKQPVILDGRNFYTKLLILRAHKRAHHGFNETVVNDLRQQLWILHLRPTVRSVARECMHCVLRRTRPRMPPLGDLPPDRLQSHARAFAYCAVDLFGPIAVTIGRRHEKRWVALYTCLTTRAVHMELVYSLSTSSAIMSLRRLAARRGWPAVMWSDNGTNLRGADAELRAAYSEWLPALQEHRLQHRMSWRFIAPGAPNMGGAWERMIRSVKTALAATLHTRAPKEEVLITLLAEVEYSLNSRPLTHVSVDPNDEEAITPNHFLLGGPAGVPLTGPCDEADRKTWKSSQALADHWWSRWLREYLPTLAPRQSSMSREPTVAVGDYVIITDPSAPRNVWQRGIVEATYPGPDGTVRNVDVRTRGGVFRRATSRLVVLPITEGSTRRSGGEL